MKASKRWKYNRLKVYEGISDKISEKHLRYSSSFRSGAEYCSSWHENEILPELDQTVSVQCCVCQRAWRESWLLEHTRCSSRNTSTTNQTWQESPAAEQFLSSENSPNKDSWCWVVCQWNSSRSTSCRVTRAGADQRRRGSSWTPSQSSQMLDLRQEMIQI